MHIASHLHRSKYGVLSLRLAIPRDLQGPLARREIKRSLRIRDVATAQYWCLALTSRFGLHFEEFWQMVRKGYDPKTFDPMDKSTWSPEASGQYRTKMNIFSGDVEIETDANVPEDHRRAMAAIKETFEQSKELLENPILQEERRLALEYRQREREALMAESLAASQGQAAAIALQAVSEALSTPPKPQPSIALAEAVKAYETSLAGMNVDTVKDYMFAVQWFERSIGPETSVAAISHEQVANWKQDLVNHYAAIREKKQAKRVAKGFIRPDPIAGLPKEDAKAGSVDKILGRAHRFMLFCQRRKYFPRDLDLPTAGLFVKSHYERKRESFYEQFEHRELERIFAPENLLNTKKPHERWIPLLGLFTGARIGEISQIHHNDIQQSKEGIWAVAISDSQMFQTVKTAAAKRVVPIHPELIKLGFLDYVADVKAAVPESDRIFPYLRYDKRNGFGDVPSEAFARYLDRLGIHGETKVHHSFRKTANQRMKENGVDVAIRSQLVGHEKEGVNEVVYATDLPLKQLHEILQTKLVFDELDFTPLKYVAGEFVEVLKLEMIAAANRKRKTDKASVPVKGATPSAVKLTESSSSTITVKKPVVSETYLSEKMKNHLAARAAREARAMPKKRGRPRKNPIAT